MLNVRFFLRFVLVNRAPGVNWQTSLNTGINSNVGYTQWKIPQYLTVVPFYI